MPINEEQISARKTTGRIAVRLRTGPVVVAGLLLAWEILVHMLEIGSSAFPSPSRVLLEIWRDAPELWSHASVTGLESFGGLLLAGLVALLVATLAVRSRLVRGISMPVLAFLQKIPLIALAPLIVVWFGFGMAPATVICFVVCFVPFARNLLAGFDAVPAEAVEILQTIGASTSRLFCTVYLPACLPYAASAAKTSIPLALAGAAATEFVGADTGLGYLMFNAGSKAESTQLFAALTVLVLIALGARAIMTTAERYWMPWAVPESMPANMDSGIGSGDKPQDRRD
jgi:ABC-type nitrate/sulfonate/bicarbonate transport system permease component